METVKVSCLVEVTWPTATVVTKTVANNMIAAIKRTLDRKVSPIIYIVNRFNDDKHFCCMCKLFYYILENTSKKNPH